MALAQELMSSGMPALQAVATSGSVNTNQTVTGSASTDATLISAANVLVTTASANQGVIMPSTAPVGDTYQIFTEPCPCGRPGHRVKVLGRVDDLLIVKGVKVYPAAIKDLVNGFVPDATGEMRIVLSQQPPRVVPPLRLRVEYRAGLDAAGQDGLRERIARSMHDRMTIRPEVDLVPAGTLPRTEKKQQLIEITALEPGKGGPA